MNCRQPWSTKWVFGMVYNRRQYRFITEMCVLGNDVLNYNMDRWNCQLKCYSQGGKGFQLYCYVCTGCTVSLSATLRGERDYWINHIKCHWTCALCDWNVFSFVGRARSTIIVTLIHSSSSLEFWRYRTCISWRLCYLYMTMFTPNCLFHSGIYSNLIAMCMIPM